MVAELRHKRDELLRRLDVGDERIWAEEKATGRPAPAHWVDTWLVLLREYEQVERDLRRAARAQ